MVVVVSVLIACGLVVDVNVEVGDVPWGYSCGQGFFYECLGLSKCSVRV